MAPTTLGTNEVETARISAIDEATVGLQLDRVDDRHLLALDTWDAGSGRTSNGRALNSEIGVIGYIQDAVMMFGG